MRSERGSAAFDAHYRDFLWGDRWDSLLDAIRQPPGQILRVASQDLAAFSAAGCEPIVYPDCFDVSCADVLPIRAAVGCASRYGWSVLPDVDGWGPIFLSRLRKRS